MARSGRAYTYTKDGTKVPFKPVKKARVLPVWEEHTPRGEHGEIVVRDAWGQAIRDMKEKA